jgi:hypothetical protein
MQLDEYDDAVFQVIKSNSKIEGLKAGTLGNLLRRAFPDDNWKTFGHPTFKSFLQRLEIKGLIRTGADESGAFAVWLGEQPQKIPVQTQKYNPLKNEVWLAFVGPRPNGRRFINRDSGMVRMGLRESPHPADQWAEINPITESEQKKWATEFVSKHCVSSPSVAQTLTQNDWSLKFAAELRAENADLAKQWNRKRSEKVSSLAAAWSDTHKIDRNLIFRQQSTAVARPVHVTSRLGSDAQARSVLMAALSQMSTDELLHLPIPARYLMKELGIE